MNLHQLGKEHVDLPGTNLLQTLTMPCNMTLTQAYEPKRDLLTSMLYKRSNTGIAQRSYTYDADGNQTRVKTSTGIWAISYDAENQPTDFTRVDSSGSTTLPS
jgi:YD repeat-containing protein